jgi:hypothetical protein
VAEHLVDRQPLGFHATKAAGGEKHRVLTGRRARRQARLDLHVDREADRAGERAHQVPEAAVRAVGRQLFPLAAGLDPIEQHACAGGERDLAVLGRHDAGAGAVAPRGQRAHRSRPPERIEQHQVELELVELVAIQALGDRNEEWRRARAAVGGTNRARRPSGRGQDADQIGHLPPQLVDQPKRSPRHWLHIQRKARKQRVAAHQAADQSQAFFMGVVRGQRRQGPGRRAQPVQALLEFLHEDRQLPAAVVRAAFARGLAPCRPAHGSAQRGDGSDRGHTLARPRL